MDDVSRALSNDPALGRRWQLSLIVGQISHADGIPMKLLVDLWHFLRFRRRLWLFPILFVLLLVGSILVFSQGSALAPFIYPFF